MRTTVNIDDDVFFAAKEIAQRDNVALGRVISDWARRSLTHFAGPTFTRYRAVAVR